MYLLTFIFFWAFSIYFVHIFSCHLPLDPRDPKKLAIRSVTMTFVNFTASLTCATSYTCVSAVVKFGIFTL